jgi:NarL family two-component system response regulator LiaR
MLDTMAGGSTERSWQRPRPAPTLRVFIVDDHVVYRCGLRAAVTAAGLQCVGEAGSGPVALRALAALPPAEAPDLLLLDLVMPGEDALAPLEAMRRLHPQMRCVGLSCELDAALLRRAADAGLPALLTKRVTAQELVTVMQTVHRGHRYQAAEVAQALSERLRRGGPGTDLTGCERKLLGLMAQGLSNQDIAERLHIAIPTVKFHVTNILSKLHVTNRTAAVLSALRHGIVSLD